MLMRDDGTCSQEKQTDHAVHVGLGPDDVVVVVDDHRSAEHVKVLHDVLLHVGQRGDVCVVTWEHTETHSGEGR